MKNTATTTSRGRVGGAKPKRNVRTDDASAFLPDPYATAHPPAHSDDEFAESLAEEFVASATAGEEISEDVRDEFTTEEVGGPFVETSGRDEFAETIDDTNPSDAQQEPFPTANGRGGASAMSASSRRIARSK